jgi:hypothetical protein
MANLSTQSLTTVVQDFATAVQGSAAQLIDFTIGSVLRAVAEATAGVALWLQGMILALLAVTRAATSSGADLDSWFADFSFARLPAIASVGQQTFARFTPTAQALIPVGAVMQSADQTVQFTVIADTINAAYSASQNGYVLPAGQASVNVTIQCTTPGSVGNVSAGEITLLGTSIPGVDSISNAAAFTNGVDAESDTAARSRFALYIASLSKATLAAIAAAITSVQTGLSYNILENVGYSGAAQAGMLTVVIDDGSGYPNSTLLANVANAIDQTRAAGVTYGVFAPTVIGAAVSMTIAVSNAPGAPAKALVVPIVVLALQSYINALPEGGLLPYSKLAQIAYEASPYVNNVTAVSVNGGTSDLVATGIQVIKYSSVVVN